MGIDRVIDIANEEREIVLALLQRYLPGVEAWVYGSRAKWTSRPQSDLDLVVFATPEQSLEVGDLREAFEESNLPFRVDLFVWDEVPKQFHQEIERDCVVLVDNTPVSVDINWPETTLGDCIEINDSTYSPKEAWSFVNYLDTGNITENCISEIQHLKTGIDTVPSRARRKVRQGDIVYSTVRPNQKHFGCLKKVPENFLVSTGFSVIRGISGVACTDYIYWFLTQSHIVDHLQTVAEHSTSTYPSIRPADIESLTLGLPPLPEQRAIAHILGALDDKIELNRRMNETLEAMAQTLFKSWFVDFDPVRAKMALNHSPSKESHAKPSRQTMADVVGGHHSPIEGESAIQGQRPPESRWGEVKRSYSEKTLNRAKSLRQNQTDAEGLLWRYLRNKQLDGYKFRRQQPIGPYIIDFACLPEKVLIELDGGQHAGHQTYDERRDQFLKSRGYRVLRFWNNQIFENCLAVLEQIYRALINSPPPNQPAPDGLPSSTPPPGGSDWTPERARAYLEQMDPKIADLFPDKLVDSELGEIPDGWDVFYLGDLAIHHTQSISPNHSDEFFAHYSIPAYDSGQMPAIEAGTEIKSNKILIPDNAVLLSKLNPEIPRIWIPQISGMNKQICSTEFLTFTPKPPANQSLLFSLFTETNFRNLLQSMVTGTSKSHQRVPAKDLKQQQVLSGVSVLFDKFDEIVNPILELVIGNRIENHTISVLRDTLLPKLISGSLRVKDAENLIERSV